MLLSVICHGAIIIFLLPAFAKSNQIKNVRTIQRTFKPTYIVNIIFYINKSNCKLIPLQHSYPRHSTYQKLYHEVGVKFKLPSVPKFRP